MPLTPTPIAESLVFWFGVILGVVMKAWGNRKIATEEDEDFTKSPSYFWLIAPSGFLIAVATVYRKENIHNHWLFGIKALMPLLVYGSDFFFGITFGILALLILKTFIDQTGAIKENASMSFLRGKEHFENVFIPVLKKVAPSMAPVVMPGLWDRFTAEGQIKTLELFLSEIDNPRDKESLEFWKKRLLDTEDKGFSFRVSLGKKELSELNLQKFQDKNYLGIEFWKGPDGTFRIQTTDGSIADPRRFVAVTEEQRGEIEPLVRKWYKKLK